MVLKEEFAISEKPTVRILGTSHLANTDNGDLFVVDTDDVLAEKRQLEIKELIVALKKFKPTKVALEVLTKDVDRLNRNYHAYLYGDFKLTQSEHQQIGFRLAKTAELTEVAAIDWNETIESIPDIGTWAEENSSSLFNEVINDLRIMTEESERFLETHTLKEYLLWLNQRDMVQRNQESYMKIVLLGDEVNPVGAMWTAQYWYYRNMLIYKNIIKLAASSNERIFVLYGAGHLHLLIHFLEESGLDNVEMDHHYLLN